MNTSAIVEFNDVVTDAGSFTVDTEFSATVSPLTNMVTLI